MMAPVQVGDAALAVNWLLRVAAIHSHSHRAVFSPQVCQPQADEAKIQSHYIPTAFPLFPAGCSSALHAGPTVVHSEEFTSDVPHFHKMVLLLAVITDFFP